MPYRAGGAGPPWAILAGAAKPTHQVRRPRVDVTIGAVIVAALATFVGATIQGSLGFGMNLVTVPALALVLPEALPVAVRSEEHTSELQSLMRISYAVFCLKKKKHKLHTASSYHEP